MMSNKGLHTLHVRNVNEIGESDQCMNDLSQQVVGTDALIEGIAQLLEHEMGKLNVKCHAERRLEREVRAERLVLQKRVMGY